jgi:methionyl-tRNA synthetase
MGKKNFYLTTTLPYVNDAPHLGFALEIVQADAVARYHKLNGDNVFFNFGTDEHGLKIYQKALEEGKDITEYCDGYALKFDALKKSLNLSYNNFIRTTDENHIRSAQEFWKKCDANGDIYKKNYKAKYCVGCELEKTDSELENGKCPIHPNKDLEIIEEENYFFKFSNYQNKLLKFYEENPNFVIPESKYNEIKTFVKSGLQDFSISRLKEKMPWGIGVPNDSKHVMFVWFDALVNYVSAIGWPDDMNNFNKWWPVTQFAGKDNLRQQTAIWQAMLMSAGLPNSKQVFIHGFVTSNGQKMSKSLGNVINPIEISEKYGTDALRYFVLAKMNPFDDSDFTFEKFEETYNADLANGLGNLISRVAKLCEKVEIGNLDRNEKIDKEISDNLEIFRFDNALDIVWQKIRSIDQQLSTDKPWEIKDNKELIKSITPIAQQILDLSFSLLPFLPETAEKIEKIFTVNKIVSLKPLFPRI